MRPRKTIPVARPAVIAWELDFLLHRQLAAVLEVRTLAADTRKRLTGLASRLAASVGAIDDLTWTFCHGDCHGSNARIPTDGPRAGQAIFFDFDDGGPGYLAYDLAVYLWASVFFKRQRFAMWHAFIDGYRSIRSITPTDFDAVRLFVPIRHVGCWVSMLAALPNGVATRCPLNGWPSKWTSWRPGRMKSYPLASCNLHPCKFVKTRIRFLPLRVILDVVGRGPTSQHVAFTPKADPPNRRVL